MPRLSDPRGACVLLAGLFCFPVCPQTTQGIILGRVVDSLTGLAVPSASILCSRNQETAAFSARAGAAGDYAVPSLSPGRYTVTVTAPRYQTQQARAVDLSVAGRVQLNFRMRPLNDLWEAGQYSSFVLPRSQQALSFYGPDVDTSRIAVFDANRGAASPLEHSRSDVISQTDIEDLPLAGRDVYTMLLLLPGVTSDTATARGLGFSVNGQRPSSSNYLLDGVENNNYLVTGPLTAAFPEFVQEYRVSTTNYSAEYGRTSGFVANAVTRSGGDHWHTRALFNLETDRMNANGFQENANGVSRPPFTQIQPGLLVSGPLLRNRLFLFGAFETLRSHGRGDPQQFGLPTVAFISSTSPTSYAGQLLRAYRPAVIPTGPGDIAQATISPVTALNREDALLRLDYNLSEGQHVFARLTLDRISEPYLNFSPYQGLSTPFQQHSLSVAAGTISRLGFRNQNEFRVARSGDLIRLASPHPELPTLIDDEIVRNSGEPFRVVLPGSPTQNSYRHGGASTEFLDNWKWVGGRHILTFGGGFLQRGVDLRTSVYPQGFLEFAKLSDFAANKLAYLQAQFDRTSATHEPVAPDHMYRYRRSYAFAQDSFHAKSRLSLDYGIRYEYFGAPVNRGAQKDFQLNPGAGSDVSKSIANITQVLPGAASDQTVFTAKPSNWAVRAGLGWDLFGTGRSVLRAAYGVFYDPLFDNTWENIIQNRYHTGQWTFAQPVLLPSPLSRLEAAGTFQPSTELIPGLAFQPNLRSPRTQSAFVGLQQRLALGVTLELDALASRGRGLITTDQVNRPNATSGYLYPDLPNYINYRANQGKSDYAALVTAVRFRKKRLEGQISYTWSHSIDNQSEPLAGTFFDFNGFTSAQKGDYSFISSFTRQFASTLDRGNSDFDQRHNLVFFGTYRPPTIGLSRRLAPLVRDWNLSGLGAIRSGLPYTVYAPADYSVSGAEVFINQRADLTAPNNVYRSEPVAGGRVLLNANAFANPGPNVIGTSGRNAFTGPGLFSLDASIARSFPLLRSREASRLTLRADFFNVLNHANLNNPESYLGGPRFGIAQYGRRENNSGFPLLAPLNESGRQVQILLRVDF